MHIETDSVILAHARTVWLILIVALFTCESSAPSVVREGCLILGVYLLVSKASSTHNFEVTPSLLKSRKQSNQPVNTRNHCVCVSGQ